MSTFDSSNSTSVSTILKRSYVSDLNNSGSITRRRSSISKKSRRDLSRSRNKSRSRKISRGRVSRRRSSYEENQRKTVKNAFAVGSWLQNDVLLPQYIDVLIKNGYDDMGTIEHTLKERDLLDIGIKVRGHRKKIMLFVKRLRTKHKARWSHTDAIKQREIGYVNHGENVYRAASRAY